MSIPGSAIAWLLLSCASASAVQTNASVNRELSAEEWQADVRFLANALASRHPNAFHHTPRAQFDSAADALLQAVPGMRRHEIIVGMMALTALVRDGHTQLNPGLSPAIGFRFLPVRFHLFDDGLHVLGASPAHAADVGARVIAFGDLPAADAIARARSIAGSDNESGANDGLVYLLARPEILHALRIVDDMDAVALRLEKDGRQYVRTVHPLPLNAEGAPQRGGHWPHFGPAPGSDWPDARDPGVAVPMWLERQTEPYWSRYLAADQTLYVQYNAIGNRPNGEAVADFFRRVLAEADTAGAERFILDLRRNGGGNNDFNPGVVAAIVRSRLSDKGRFFTLVGRRTFSAAQNLASDLETFTDVTFVGEPTGGAPNHYGDAATVTLPNSEIPVRISTVLWQDKPQRDRRRSIEPALRVSFDFAHYLRGRDPVLEAALEAPIPPTG